MEERTKRHHRNAIKHIYEFWEVNIPDYCEVGIRDLTAEERSDGQKDFWNNTKDLVYEGINSRYIKAYLSQKIRKSSGKLMSFDTIRKYWDTVQYGAREANVLLHVSFYQEKDKYLQAFKKQIAKEKGEGNVDEREADPIPWKLFVLICTWVVSEGNILLWVWSILQWNLMARSINIEPLAFHNFTVFNDTIQVKYDFNKANRTGKKTSIKHVYANLLNPSVCSFLSLGIYLCLNTEKFEETERIFKRSNDKKAKVASAGYCSMLKELMVRKAGEVIGFIQLAHSNAHGFWKGSGTHATSGTTFPPPIPLVARRGEWSLGKVLDVYWHFAEPGDCYLGRILARLDALKPTFSVLPPHFNMTKPLENVDICEALHLMYGSIITKWGGSERDPTAMLMRVLASVVHHFDWIKMITAKRTNHPFNVQARACIKIKGIGDFGTVTSNWSSNRDSTAHGTNSQTSTDF